MLDSMIPPKVKWTSDDIPDLSSKVAIVTGANVGIGFETALALAKKKGSVYLACRSAERAAEAIVRMKEILEKEGIKGYELNFLKCDLASLNSVKNASEEFKSKSNRLDILLCSAGVSAASSELKTVDNVEIHMGTNVLGHYYLIENLLPTLLQTVSKAPKDSVRCVLTSSVMATMASNFGGFSKTDPILSRENSWLMSKSEEWTVIRRYAHSKLCDTLLANKLSREYGKDGIIFCSADPGGIRTELTRNVFGISWVIVKFLLNPFLLYPPWMGALTQLYAATSPSEDASLGGKFLIPWSRVGGMPKAAEDIKAQDDLYTWCQQQVQGR